MYRTCTALLTLLFVGQSLAVAITSTCNPPCKYGAGCGAGQCDCPDFTYYSDCSYIRLQGPTHVAAPGEPAIGGCLPGKYPCQRTQCDKPANQDWGTCDCPENTGGMFCEVITIAADGSPVAAPAVPPIPTFIPTVPATCRLTTCSLNGVCTNTPTGVSCACNAGWTGANCATETCKPDSCSYKGACTVSLGEAVSCSCYEGWTGPRCNTEMCTPMSCNGNGKCLQHFGSTTTCDCETGYTGATCKDPVASATPVASPPPAANPTPVASPPPAANPTPVASPPPAANPTPVASPPPAANPTPVASPPPAANPTPVASPPPVVTDPECVDVVCPTGQTCKAGECECINPAFEGDMCDEPVEVEV